MASISARRITESSVAGSTTAAATAGDNFVNSGIEFVKISNDHASAHYAVTFTPSVTSIKSPRWGAVTKSAVVVQVTNGTEAYIGPFKQESWNAADNTISITYAHGTGTGEGGKSVGDAIGSGSHLLKMEVLYLDLK